MSKPRLVLDTNVVLDLFVFDDACTRPLRVALDSGRVCCSTSAATLEEWRRVLAYPEFALADTAQAALFARYAELGVRCEAQADTSLPRCSDPDDQKFLELAAAADADVLVSKDRALLKLRRRCRFRIAAPDDVVAELALPDAQPAVSV